jgi:hypothetical protein
MEDEKVTEMMMEIKEKRSIAEEKFQETVEMEIFIKALKTTFWFFVYSGIFLLGIFVGKEFF